MHLYEISIAASLLMAATLAVLRLYRSSVYRDLDRRQRSMARLAGGTALLPARDAILPSFERCLAVLPDALPVEHHRRLVEEIESLGRTERSYLPTHKKGGTVAYETLCSEAPNAVALYLSPGFHDLISRIVGVGVMPTPLHDQSSCSVLFYERPGDHIGWHYDHNFYKGRHFTVLLPIVNRDATGQGLSAARLQVRIAGEEREIPTPPNQLVVFEGAKVLHKATPIDEGERRILLSMTFATDTRSSVVQGIARRIKDTAFFGIRALWT